MVARVTICKSCGKETDHYKDGFCRECFVNEGLVSHTKVAKEIENSFWYCNKCDKFYFHTAYLTGKFNWSRGYHPYCNCGARLISCAWLLHISDKHRKLAEINCKSLDKLTRLCRTCKQRFRCWSERF